MPKTRVRNMDKKGSEKLIDYIETNILAGIIKMGDRLPPERRLAQKLNISRSAVREGMRFLEVIGILESRQGSGNYIAQHADQTLELLLTMVYTLDGLHTDEILEFRYQIERIALMLAMRKADDQGRKQLQQYLNRMLYARSTEEWVENDRLLHLSLVQMSRNQLLISNYSALNRVLRRLLNGTYDKKIRKWTRDRFAKLWSIHRKLVMAVLDGNIEKGKEAINQYYTVCAQ